MINFVNKNQKQNNILIDIIFKKYNFKNFKKTLEFVNQIGAIAEKESHHHITPLFKILLVHKLCIKFTILQNIIIIQ